MVILSPCSVVKVLDLIPTRNFRYKSSIFRRYYCADVIGDRREANSSRNSKITVSVNRTSLYYLQSWKQLHFTLKSAYSNVHVIQKLLTSSNSLSNLTWISFFERLIIKKCQINHVLEWENVTTPNSSYVYFKFNPFSSNCVFLFDFIGSVFSRIMNFPSHAEPIVSWLVLTLIGKFLGNFWDRFTGKLIQSSIREFQGVWQAVLLEDSSRPNVICHISLMVSVKKFEWMSFPVKRPVWRVTDDPENENFRKISRWVFYDLPIRVKAHCSESCHHVRMQKFCQKRCLNVVNFHGHKQAKRACQKDPK